VVGLFLETVRRPAAFEAALQRLAEAGKVAIVLKVGTSELGAQAALAHTGALVGSDRGLTAMLRHYNAIRVDDFGVWLEHLEVFSRATPPRGRRIGAVTNSGGEGEYFADKAEQAGIPLQPLSDGLTARIKAEFPNFSDVGNPADCWAIDDDRIVFPRVFQLMAESGEFDVLVSANDHSHWLHGDERAAAVALAIAIPAYLLHALADIDWDFVAVSAPVFFLGGLLIGMDGTVREVRVRGRPLLAAGGVAVCLLAGVYSLAAPWLAANRVQDAYSAIFSNDLRVGAADARDAASLNPFSIQPIWALAAAYTLVPDVPGTVREYEQATRLQPENPDTWVALGEYELCHGDVLGAYRALNQAYTLDPFGPAGIPGGPLDQARAAVEKRGRPTCRG
jgi:hypothetical protein